MDLTSVAVNDYCTSEQFFFLDSPLKEHAESLLVFWCNRAGDDITDGSIKAATQQVAYLDVPLPIRKAFPKLLRAFFEYLADSGRIPDAQGWSKTVSQMEQSYVKSFREDGSVRRETFQKGYPNVGRNDPCPCGSGKKYKKCCYGIFS
ncbi:MAG: SEC-C metal-binding domain-containing protein [Gemmatimonadota bacterium]|nr:SEC-C metal-binding domain-containing protein [Gemmatimonadota bacterium]